jgi:esterase/lipase superfamily enzyme
MRRCAGLALLLLLVAACASGRPYRIELMPSPALYAQGILDPFAGSGPVDPDYDLLYATDREPAAEGDSEPFYTSERGHALRVGAAGVMLVADPPLDWEQTKRESLAADREGRYPLQVAGREEYGVLDAGLAGFTGVAADEIARRRFARTIDGYLERAQVKDVFIYVPGFKVVFEDPVLVAAELWHFLGYEGVFLAYSWPATPSVWAYTKDIETAAYSARNLRVLIEFLSRHTTARRIHLLGYSAGTRVVFGAVSQIVLLDRDRSRYRLGHVILAAGDVDGDLAASYLADGLLDACESFTLYQSGGDAALGFSKWLFSRKRLGQVGSEENLSERARRWLLEHRKLVVIDATEAEGATGGNGHGYFRKSPWASSDILLTLRYDLAPAARGLVRDEGSVTWRFPPDYVERLRAIAAGAR